MSVHKYVFQKTREIIFTDVFQLKKRLLIMSFILRFFLMGVEYSIILPTAILYMRTFQAGPFMTGVTIAAYPAAAIISLPLFGYLYDRTKRLRELLLLLNFFEALGNLLYALPYAIWMPPLGRFVAGIGDGFLALTVGELTYLYPDKKRLGILSLMEFGRVLGLIIGPSFNFLIEDKTIQLQTWILDNNTLPGVVMALLWTMLELITVTCVYNLAKELIEINEVPHHLQEEKLPLTEDLQEELGEESDVSVDNEEKESELLNNSQELSNESLFHPTLTKKGFDEEQGDSPTESLCSSIESDLAPETVGSGVFHEKEKKTNKEYWKSLKEIFCFEFIIIAVADFVLWFCQTNFEILAPYITELNYGWTPQLTGMIYVVGGILIIVVFLILYMASSKCRIKDSYLLVVSLVCTQLSLGLIIYESIAKTMKARQSVFSIGGIFVFISIPLNLVCSKNLLSKLFRPELMGMVQGISSGISRITMITGPLLSGYIFKDRVTYGAVTSVFVFTTIVAFFAGMDYIHKRERRMKREMKIQKQSEN